jgi:hypothetical protein
MASVLPLGIYGETSLLRIYVWSEHLLPRFVIINSTMHAKRSPVIGHATAGPPDMV